MRQTAKQASLHSRFSRAVRMVPEHPYRIGAAATVVIAAALGYYTAQLPWAIPTAVLVVGLSIIGGPVIIQTFWPSSTIDGAIIDASVSEIENDGPGQGIGAFAVVEYSTRWGPRHLGQWSAELEDESGSTHELTLVADDDPSTSDSIQHRTAHDAVSKERRINGSLYGHVVISDSIDINKTTFELRIQCRDGDGVPVCLNQSVDGSHELDPNRSFPGLNAPVGPPERMFAVNVDRSREIAIEKLGELRAEGVGLYAEQLSGPDAYPDWSDRVEAWRGRAEKVIDEDFSSATLQNFTHLGAIPGMTYGHAVSSEHNHSLAMLSVRLERLRNIVHKHAD